MVILVQSHEDSGRLPPCERMLIAVLPRKLTASGNHPDINFERHGGMTLRHFTSRDGRRGRTQPDGAFDDRSCNARNGVNSWRNKAL
jgi:hypothetical protein